MDRELLAGWLKRGLSLGEIAALMNRDPSTVGYWVKKHGLTPNGRRKFAGRGGIERHRLESLIARGATLQQMADELDRSMSTVRHWLQRYGLKVARHHGNQAEAVTALADGRKRFTGVCPHHGETEFLAFPSGRHRCGRCNIEAVMRRRRKVKEILVAEAGGCCARCGFDEHPSALQFHHVDPSQKEFGIGHKGITLSIARAREEAAKCVLLCASCHAMVEAGVVSLS